MIFPFPSNSNSTASISPIKSVPSISPLAFPTVLVFRVEHPEEKVLLVRDTEHFLLRKNNWTKSEGIVQPEREVKLKNMIASYPASTKSTSEISRSKKELLIFTDQNSRCVCGWNALSQKEKARKETLKSWGSSWEITTLFLEIGILIRTLTTAQSARGNQWGEQDECKEG